jgi:hypothetical protein
MASKPKGAAYGSVGLSVLAVVLLTIGFPFLMGGSVNLAVMFADEIMAKESPDDDNGFKWLEAGTCSTSSATMQNTVSSFDSVNWTSASMPYGTCWSATRTTDVFTISIPDQMFNHTDSMSKFNFTHISNSYCDGCAQHWQYSYNVTINSTEIFTGNNANSKLYSTASHDHFQISFNHRMDGLELMKVRDAIGDCDPNCDIQLNVFDITKGTITGYDYSSQPFNQGKMKIQTFTTDAEMEGLIMTISPYLITLITLLIAVGSTQWWQPLKGWYRQ